MPKDKFVVLGLLSSKRRGDGTVERLKERIEEASKCPSASDQLGLSPQCGFSTSASERAEMTIEVEKAKLSRVVDVAKQVWGA